MKLVWDFRKTVFAATFAITFGIGGQVLAKPIAQQQSENTETKLAPVVNIFAVKAEKARKEAEKRAAVKKQVGQTNIFDGQRNRPAKKVENQPKVQPPKALSGLQKTSSSNSSSPGTRFAMLPGQAISPQPPASLQGKASNSGSIKFPSTSIQSASTPVFGNRTQIQVQPAKPPQEKAPVISNVINDRAKQKQVGTITESPAPIVHGVLMKGKPAETSGLSQVTLTQPQTTDPAPAKKPQDLKQEQGSDDSLGQAIKDRMNSQSGPVKRGMSYHKRRRIQQPTAVVQSQGTYGVRTLGNGVRVIGPSYSSYAFSPQVATNMRGVHFTYGRTIPSGRLIAAPAIKINPYSLEQRNILAPGSQPQYVVPVYQVRGAGARPANRVPVRNFIR